MKYVTIALLVACSAVSPMEKTIQLLEGLSAKIVKEGESEAALYEKFTAYCNDESKETQFEVKTSKADAERASASLADETAKIGAAEAKIEELSTTIATAEKDLSSATKIREKENADFTKVEAELMEGVSMLERAIAIIEREMAKTGFIQGADSMKKVSDALQVVMDAGMVNSQDRTKVQALLQAQTAEGEDDLELQPAGAPDPAAYKSKSGGIVDVLEDMLEKAKAELADAQKAEMNSKFDYEQLKQKLEDAMKFGTKELGETKSAKAAAEEAKAVAENDLAVADKSTAEGSKHLSDLQNECMTKASEYEESQHGRQGELTALATAKKILEEKTGGASDREYSFLQIRSSTSAGARAKKLKDRVVNMLQALASKDDSNAISLLADRVEAASMMGEDPFAKIKGLISEMIEKLEADAAKEAGHKAFCDKEMSETKAKKEEKESDLDTLGTKIDKATSKIAKLKEEIATLTEELGAIAAAQKEADEIRMAEKEAWAAAKADYESGVEGVGMALQVLRDYYAEKDEALIQAQHDKATGAATGIIGMLEVIESDFTKSLADGSATEAMAIEAYEKLTQDNKIATTEKETAVEYKTKDQKETEARLSGLKEDKASAEKEYAAIMEYWEKLQPMCIAKPEPYAERKKRREAEIAGLKEALTILEEEAGSPAFLQVRTARRAA
jgi:type II secretory pathway component PulJ